MQLISGGPDLPDELVRAQERGEVLFVAGAGVSRNAGLPLFKGLVQAIYGHLGEEWQSHPVENEIMKDDSTMIGQYDRVLRALERRLIGADSRTSQSRRERFREAVRTSLLPSDDANLTAHLNIFELSRDAEHNNRVLTTNFDTLFEKAWRKSKHVDSRSHACQAMPQPKTAGFTGVFHLHGRLFDAELALAETDLVLTSAEFGDAYLRNGWASRYLYDVVRTHTLVLVGYSADDPPMRYLLEALEADRERFLDLKPIYAFDKIKEPQRKIQEALWRSKGIEPILYQHDESNGHTRLYHMLVTGAKVWASMCLVLRTPTIK